MKIVNIFVVLFTVVLLSSCSKNDHGIKNVEKKIEDVKLSESQLKDIKAYWTDVNSQMFNLIQTHRLDSYAIANKARVAASRNLRSDSVLSPAFDVYYQAVQNSSRFASELDYQYYIHQLVDQSKNDQALSTEEKTRMLILQEMMDNFVANGGYFESAYQQSLAAANGKIDLPTPGGPFTPISYTYDQGWWPYWGKCAAGILGGAIMGGLQGGAYATPTVVGIPVGIALGVIGGGLLGGSAAC
ncbi:hypothetical protein [Chitinophaga sp. Cy-1792]|uniref:hypothetical protein n=1 Tax=Chitinophaga sp. Cy-1792 TaxID=2608339 RepID=UPI001422628F|nr:hypothetical protein [Chitinophaga sp. Cy-1792]NIG56515.1 hypothetical protein [Chitinophaga sp. Cy-1792]